MTEHSLERVRSTEVLLLGDEAVAEGALDAGIAAAYGYPGTPSTEIVERLGARAGDGGPLVAWCANEKSAYEQALGVSLAGRRALVVMKHVGLNVAADPFVSSALLDVRGGLVLAVADDPGMASSQNEQDSRVYAELARIPCFEPADPQEAYDMTREAFHLSERFATPVMVRLVTRLAHCRAPVRTRTAEAAPPVERPWRREGWVLLPGNARRRWREVLDRQLPLEQEGEDSFHDLLTIQPGDRTLGVVTAGVARYDYLECLPELQSELGLRPSHLHVGLYPEPLVKLRRLAEHVDALLVLEEGRPWLERRLRGVVLPGLEIRGRESGHLPADGGLSPDLVRAAFGLPERPRRELRKLRLPARPPRLCDGCPHRDSFGALRQALDGLEPAVVMGDIGCYTLGALPPFQSLDTCVSMGASVGMAKGLAELRQRDPARPVVAVIGDSTFLHSGLPALIEAAAADTDMTLLILDNGAVAMTGAQDPLAPASGLEPLLLGLGVHPDRCRLVKAHPRNLDGMAAVLREEVGHRGLSVVVAVRECVEHARRRKAVAARRRKEVAV